VPGVEPDEFKTLSANNAVKYATCIEAQKHLLALQGRDHLWLAGWYMHDIDWHERAVVSAVKIARQLAPDATNLSMLRLIESS